MLTLLSILGSVLPVVGIIAIAAYFMDWRASPSEKPGEMLPPATPPPAERQP